MHVICEEGVNIIPLHGRRRDEKEKREVKKKRQEFYSLEEDEESKECEMTRYIPSLKAHHYIDRERMYVQYSTTS